MANNLIEQYKLLHAADRNYGGGFSLIYLEAVRLVIDYLKPKTVLDFGCGKAALIKTLANIYPKIEFYGYDPAIPGRDTLPIEKADLVINTDVLEHIHEDMLPDVIAKIASISDNVFFALHHALACAILPNGENAHCTVKPPHWYYDFFSKYFKTPYPLPGQLPELSACITFSPTIAFINDYHRIVSPAQVVSASPPVEAPEAQTITTIKRGILLPRWLGLFLSCFIPKKEKRQRFREKYVRGK